jgi:hypothetical protein
LINLKSEGLSSAVIYTLLVSSAVICIASLSISQTRIIGPMIFLTGFIPWIPLKLSGRTIRSTGADIVFGLIDTGFLGVAALIGANFAGVLGAIVGGAVGDAITDALAGLFEGRMSEYLRKHGIEEARSPLSSSMGKMSGCLIGAGLVLTFAWNILKIKIST